MRKFLLLMCFASACSAPVTSGGGGGGGASTGGGSSTGGSGGGTSTGGGSASTGGGTSTGGGSVDAGPPGTPISADAGVWTYVPFPDSSCANGSPAGIGINLASTSRVLVYFEGGGACWDQTTCYILKTAVNVDVNYTQNTFQSDVGVLEASGVFVRDGGSPFGDATWVYVPYCTGDLHSGTTMRTYNTQLNQVMHYQGGNNVDAFLKRLTATLPSPIQVWISGSSAGGYGATFNLDRFAAAYPNAELDLLEDSSPFISNPNWGTWKAEWQPVLPCTGCTDMPAIFTAYQAEHPNARIGLLSYVQDSVIPTFFAISTQQFTTELGTLTAASFTTAKDQYFEEAGMNHVLLGNYRTLMQSNVALKTFVDGWADGDAGWASVHP